MSATFPAATVLGYPRIGADRELKFALEKAWSSDSPAETEACAPPLTSCAGPAPPACSSWG